ncbi:MAG: flagellar basal body-associated FliL family protein [Candidatus Latescibacterota bacterium]
MAGEKKTFLKIAVIAVVVLVVDVAAGYLILKVVIPKIYRTEEVAAEKKGKKEKAPSVPGLQKALAPINLNPSNSGGEILSAEIVLEAKAEDQLIIDEVTAREAQIQDILSSYLSFKTVAELNDITKRDQYKKEMLDKLNSILKQGKLTGLYTKSWIIQFE